MTERSAVRAPILLAVLPHGDDRRSIRHILRPANWQFRFARRFEQARRSLRATPFTAIITENFLPDGHSWRDLLGELHALPHAPPLIVTDRLADEALWAEVLNLGGYDLLMKPFEEKEVLHVLAMAQRLEERWAQLHPSGCPLQPKDLQIAPPMECAMAGG